MAMVPAVAGRAMAYRLGSYAMRGAARRPRYKLPSWLTAANVAGAYKATRSARARMSTYAKRAVGRLSRKRAQGQARRQAVGKTRKRVQVRGAMIGKPPTNPSSRVPARYAVADTMTKYKAVKQVKRTKVPKSLGYHYKDFGEYNAERCLYINHEHWGSEHRFWDAIALGTTKTILARAQLYPGKLLTDPMQGPRTDNIAIFKTDVNASVAPLLRLTFIREVADGIQNFATNDVNLVDLTENPDKYISFGAVAALVATAMEDRYKNDYYLSAASVLETAGLLANGCNLQNLEDAEICLYVKSLLKFQNVTPADGGGLTTDSISRNPLEGRIYTGRGCTPTIDDDLSKSGDTTLSRYFGDQDPSGITLCGKISAATANDIGRITHIPPPRQLYSNVTVSSATIHMAAGAMKFHSTSFTLKRTFKTLVDIIKSDETTNKQHMTFGAHTLFGFTPQHKHGDDTIKIGYNREVDTSCFIKYNPKIHTIKTNFAVDQGVKTVSTVPTEHADY